MILSYRNLVEYLSEKLAATTLKYISLKQSRKKKQTYMPWSMHSTTLPKAPSPKVSTISSKVRERKRV